jgi:hypothetical protein
MLALGLARAVAEEAPASVEQRLQRVEEQLKQALERIRELEGQQGSSVQSAATPAEQPAAKETPQSTESPGREPEEIVAEVGGSFEPGTGFVLARGEAGEVDFSAWTYARYINQERLEDSYTDAFGRTRELDLRQDFQLQKINLYFKGWIFDPKLRYVFYTWTSNTSLGDVSQVVVAGYLNYLFDEKINVGLGIGGLPSTRTTQGVWPNMLKVDHRTIGDEYFRGSYTSGIWAAGKLADGLKYRIMFGNNLSQFGVNAVQLDKTLNTYSGALWWMPTTGEFGPGEGFGDFESHDEVATLVGVHFTRSREDAQSQPGTEAPENTQIRLSDGTVIFQPDAFGTGGQIDRATYRMAALDTGMKFRGFSLDAEYYWRWVDDFSVTGTVPVDELFDHGFEAQASAMLIPRVLQIYVAGSKIFGEYGQPWDASLASTGFPTARRTSGPTCRCSISTTLRWGAPACRISSVPMAWRSPRISS